nr:MAG TPA: hypothetical protein [Caudoviricetes sp.]
MLELQHGFSFLYMILISFYKAVKWLLFYYLKRYYQPLPIVVLL